MKKEHRNKNGMPTLCVFPIITPRPSLQSYTMHAGRGGVIYREYTEFWHPILVSVFHQSSLHQIAKCFFYLFVFFFQPHMHACISMSELREDRLMIAHACDECVWRVLFFSDIICSGHYLESLALFLWQVL